VGATGGIARALETADLRATEALEGALLATAEVLDAVLGCDFHNQLRPLDSTETEKATAAQIATLATSSEATERLDLLGFPLLRVVKFRRR
jgi:hypothetical protein